VKKQLIFYNIGIIKMFQHYATPFDKDEHEHYADIKEPDLYVISVVDRTDSGAFQRLLDSGKKHGITVTPIVTKEPIGHGKGFGMKIKGMYDYIQNKQPNDIIMFIDGFDVLITGSKSEILNGYQAFRDKHGDKAVFSAEKTCWPDSHLAERFPVTPSPYKYLNSGTYMSTVSALKRILANKHDEIYGSEFYKTDDQRFFTDLFLNTSGIVLDNSNTIFNCMNDGLDDLVVEQGRWRNLATKSTPLVYHANGGPVAKNFLFDKIF
jgi:hypothetical protein